MANFYISDLHIGHENILRFDNRPFADVNEMNNKLIENWNARVRSDDTVYILGDFIWAKESEWPSIVGSLAGNKVLIRGNHDPKQFSAATRRMFQEITDLKEIKDSGKHVVMCHYPIPFFATVYKGNIIKNLIMDCQSYTKYRPNETTGGIFVSWRRKEELPTGA